MPWAADEPTSLDEKAELLRRFRSRFDLGEDFVYGILASDESEVVGGSGLHTRIGTNAFEIGTGSAPRGSVEASRVRRLQR